MKYKRSKIAVMIRIPIELAEKMDAARAGLELPTTRSALIETLIRRWVSIKNRPDVEKIPFPAFATEFARHIKKQEEIEANLEGTERIVDEWLKGPTNPKKISKAQRETSKPRGK